MWLPRACVHLLSAPRSNALAVSGEHEAEGDVIDARRLLGVLGQDAHLAPARVQQLEVLRLPRICDIDQPVPPLLLQSTPNFELSSSSACTQ